VRITHDQVHLLAHGHHDRGRQFVQCTVRLQHLFHDPPTSPPLLAGRDQHAVRLEVPQRRVLLRGGRRERLGRLVEHAGDVRWFDQDHQVPPADAHPDRRPSVRDAQVLHHADGRGVPLPLLRRREHTRPAPHHPGGQRGQQDPAHDASRLAR
jgi:hypothetical protein